MLPESIYFEKIHCMKIQEYTHTQYKCLRNSIVNRYWHIFTKSNSQLKQSAHVPSRHFTKSVYEISTTLSFHSGNVAVMHKLHEFGCQCVFPRITVPHVWPWGQLIDAITWSPPNPILLARVFRQTSCI